MARRKKGESGGANLDSLLDTMTNVVGILVIVLVVTQLGVNDAVDRITTSIRLSDAEMEAAKQAWDQAKLDREDLQGQLEFLQFPEPVSTLGTITSDIAAVHSEIDEYLKKRQNEEAANLKRVEEAKQLVDQFRQKEEQLKKEIVAANDQVAKLRALLEDTPQREILPAKVVNLPNPRPAPEGAKPLYLVCREGQIFYWDRDELRQRAQQQAELLVTTQRLNRDPTKGIEADKLIPAFNSRRINDKQFMLKLKANGRQAVIVFERMPNGGISMKDLENLRGLFRRLIRSIDPQKQYLQFTVWPDSFDLYLEARQIANEFNIPAGWEPNGSPNELEMSLGGLIAFGPPPPKPSTPPPPPSPNTPPPKPANVID